MSDNPFVKDATLVNPKQDPGGMAIVVLDRIEPGVVPDYCCHGKSTCWNCRDWCWLGDQTYDLVRSGEAAGLCRECAAKMVPKGAKPTRNLKDHRRADGPH